jgi:hypothetical protein
MQQLLNNSTTHFSDPNCIPFTNLSKGSLLALEDMGLRQIFRVVFEDDMSECQPLVEAGFTGGVANCGDKQDGNGGRVEKIIGYCAGHVTLLVI